MIKLIICDIGGVVEDFSERKYIEYICGKHRISKGEFRSVFMPMLDKVEVGKETTYNMLGVLARRFGIKAKDLEFSSSFAKLAKPNLDVVKLINSLHKRYAVVLLTNVSRSRYLENSRVGLFRDVGHERIFASCYLGMAKPDRRIYRYVLDRMGFVPGEAIFIDDKQTNVRGASAVGIRGIRFTGYGRLVRELKNAGIRW
jgi:HAD superfamily hydrolase (TIGR01509 family)